MPLLSAHFTIGSARIAALSDGAPARALGGFFAGVEESEWTRALGIPSAETTVPFNFGSFLIRHSGRTILVDSGYGIPALSMGIPGGGGLLDRIDEVGVAREDIDAVFFTHLHPDHCGWNTGAEGEITFPNATLYVAQTELDFWLSAEAPADRAAVAKQQTLPYQVADRIHTFTGEFEVAPGITTVPTPGHTPGHTSLMVASAGQHLLITGDAAHHPVHVEHHTWIPGVDLDPAESTRSRGKLAALAADRDALVTGGHFAILTLGKVRRDGDIYTWEYIERPGT
jgi:glyoxylase-like metal-dependent hydrolase (beta-lactamase superfamily II)